MAFEHANEFSELVIGDTVGIRVANGAIEFKTLTVDSNGVYVLSGNAPIAGVMMNETKRDGWQQLTFAHSFSDKTDNENYGVHTLEQWKINDSRTFLASVPHDYKIGTAIYPFINWRAMSENPSATHKVQFDLTYQIAQTAFSNNTAISIVDSSFAYNYKQKASVTAMQAIPGASLAIGALIMITVKRVKPAAGISYSGDVVVDMLAADYESDMVLTNQRNAPFTKVTT